MTTTRQRANPAVKLATMPAMPIASTFGSGDRDGSEALGRASGLRDPG
jgi:hypothetical protein